MALTKKLQQKGERLAELLAQSTLDDAVKELILDNLEKLPEDRITGLISVLEGEQHKTQEIVSSIQAFLKDQDQRWSDTEAKQEAHAQKFIDAKLDEFTRE